jgi:hypothetical protein
MRRRELRDLVIKELVNNEQEAKKSKPFKIKIPCRAVMLKAIVFALLSAQAGQGA